MKLTNQEQNIINFLKNKSEAYWEQLAQFAKEPSKVKLKTVKKSVSDIKKKYKDQNLPPPFNCNIILFTAKNMQEEKETITVNNQKLVRVTKANPKPIQIQQEAKKQCQIDFILKKYQNQVMTKSGLHNLNDDDMRMFEYFYHNPEKIIPLEELRDKVAFPLYGSKLPSRWFSSIQSRINNIRRSVPELKNKILTVKLDNNNSGYMFR